MLGSRFLDRLFATDGTAWVARAGYARIGYGSVSEQLARDVAHALLRFGIRTKLRERSMKYRDSRRRAFEVEIMDAPSMLTFCDEIGILGKRGGGRSCPCGRRHGAARAIRSTRAGARCGTTSSRRRASCQWAEINRRCGAVGVSTTGIRPDVVRCAARPSRSSPRRSTTTSCGGGRRQTSLGPHRVDRAGRRDAGHRLHRARGAQLRRRRHVPPQHRVRPGHGDARGQAQRPSRCSCSRWRWATSS